MEAVVIATVTAIPATIASLAAWRAAKRAAFQTNGQLHDPIRRIEEKLDELSAGQLRHLDRWHSSRGGA